jgi:hypothetical protein
MKKRLVAVIVVIALSGLPAAADPEQGKREIPGTGDKVVRVIKKLLGSIRAMTDFPTIPKP